MRNDTNRQKVQKYDELATQFDKISDDLSEVLKSINNIRQNTTCFIASVRFLAIQEDIEKALSTAIDNKEHYFDKADKIHAEIVD